MVAAEATPVEVLRPEMVFVESVIMGVLGARTVKSVALVAAGSPATSTVIGPVVAPDGTVAVMTVPAPFTVLNAAIPLNFTPGVAPKLLPLIVTVSPTKPEDGENEVIEGAVPAGVEVTATLSKLILGLLPVVPTLLAY